MGCRIKILHIEHIKSMKYSVIHANVNKHENTTSETNTHSHFSSAINVVEMSQAGAGRQ